MKVWSINCFGFHWPLREVFLKHDCPIRYHMWNTCMWIADQPLGDGDWVLCSPECSVLLCVRRNGCDSRSLLYCQSIDGAAARRSVRKHLAVSVFAFIWIAFYSFCRVLPFDFHLSSRYTWKDSLPIRNLRSNVITREVPSHINAYPHVFPGWLLDVGKGILWESFTQTPFRLSHINAYFRNKRIF